MADAQAAPLPRTLEAEGGDITLRLMTRDDREAMLAFARALPQHDLLFLRRDITQPAEVDAWIADTQSRDLVTILAVRDGRIVGYSMVDRSPWNWSRHVAELRVLVSPEARGHRLGRTLTMEAFRVAYEMGVEKMTAQMTTDQRGALNVFQGMGFQNEAVLIDQVKDRDGKKHDLIVLRREVSDFEASVLIAEEQFEQSGSAR